MTDQNSVALDFREARKKAGLRQVDVAHLLGVQEARVSQIESGKVLPTVIETAMLSIVYGKEMESLLSGLIDRAVSELVERLKTVPPVPRDLAETFNRRHTLQSLARRLEVLSATEHAGA